MNVGLVAETLLLVILAVYLHRGLKSKGEQWNKLLVKITTCWLWVYLSFLLWSCLLDLLFSVVCTITLHIGNPKAELCKYEMRQHGRD